MVNYRIPGQTALLDEFFNGILVIYETPTGHPPSSPLPAMPARPSGSPVARRASRFLSWFVISLGFGVSFGRRSPGEMLRLPLSQQLVDLLFQFRQIFLNSAPDDLRLHVEVGVNDDIAHVAHVRPWNLGMLSHELRGRGKHEGGEEDADRRSKCQSPAQRVDEQPQIAGVADDQQCPGWTRPAR